jgi:uncharacterized membrane protein
VPNDAPPPRRRPGRPPLGDAAAKARIAIRLTADEHNELRRVAAETRSSVAAFVRDAVTTYMGDLDERKTPPRR